MRWVGAGVVLGLGAASLVAGMVIGVEGVGPVAPLAAGPTAAAAREPVAVTIRPLEGTAAAGPSLVFASYNVCKTDCAPPAPPWDVRRDRVARTIGESSLDVVGLQEATHQPTATAKTQFLDIQGLVAAYGFAAPAYTSSSDLCRWTAGNPHPCIHTTGILFQTGTVRQAVTPNGTASAGTLPMSGIVGGLAPDSAPRKVVWAYLEGLNGTGPFLAISAHASNLRDAGNESSRVAFGAALNAWVQAHNDAHGMSGVPTVLMADLNSYAKRQPSGVQEVLVRSGWSDAAAASIRRNVEFSTINYNPQLPFGEQGFPTKPYTFAKSRTNPAGEATRIDYIMVRGEGAGVDDYEVVVRLSPDGTFDRDYQGSDHQMVRATIEFRAG